MQKMMHYKEIETSKLFTNGNQSEFDAAIADLMKMNRGQEEENRNLKLEQESQAILICEVTEQKKKAIEDKNLLEEDKRIWHIDWKRNQKSYPKSQTNN